VRCSLMALMWPARSSSLRAFTPETWADWFMGKVTQEISHKRSSVRWRMSPSYVLWMVSKSMQSPQADPDAITAYRSGNSAGLGQCREIQTGTLLKGAVMENMEIQTGVRELQRERPVFHSES
jgi:hypothetical protein